MSRTQIASNPFSQLINPGAMFLAVQNSKRLAKLESRICRPLNKPAVAQGDADVVAFDEALDQSADLSDLSDGVLA